MKVLITGVAGYIGMKVVQALLDRGDDVVGIDDLADPHEVALKYARLARYTGAHGFRFVKMDAAERPALAPLLADGGFDQVVHLATTAGGRSLPWGVESGQTGLVGFINVLEGCRLNGVKHLVYASGSHLAAPRHRPGAAVPCMASTKASAHERLAQAYSRLHNLPTTGLRFFTLYGSVGVPVGTAHGVSEALMPGDALTALQHRGDLGGELGNVDDIVRGILRALTLDIPVLSADAVVQGAHARVIPVGSQDPVRLLDLVAALEGLSGSQGARPLPPVQSGSSASDEMEPASVRAMDLVGEARATMPLAEGVQRFVHWYLGYHGMCPAVLQAPSVGRREGLFQSKVPLRDGPLQPVDPMPPGSRRVNGAY